MAPPAAEPQGNRPLPGLMVVPFLIGTGVVLLAIVGMQEPITSTWVMVAVVVGVIAAAVSVAIALHRPHPQAAALAAGGAGAPPNGDPLARVQLVEQAGRQHRQPCANCGTPVKGDDEKCANCGHAQLFECKGCRAKVRLNWDHCPECGRALH